MKREPAEVRFWRFVPSDPDPNDCWLWQGGILPNGYAQFKVNGKGTTAHRFAYQMAFGTIPAAFHVDHLCRVRHCVNPNHLDACTPRENTLRGNTPAARNAAKAHCPHGHEYTPANTGYDKGRYCLSCKRKQSLEGYHRRKVLKG